MSRRNEGKTDLNRLKSDREKYLDKSTSKLYQLKVCLDVLHEQGVDCDVIEHFYKVEERHNKRLTKLIQGED
jgi:hypothetical protein